MGDKILGLVEDIRGFEVMLRILTPILIFNRLKMASSVA